MNESEKVILQDIDQQIKTHTKQKNSVDIPTFSTSGLEKVRATVMTRCFYEVAASHIILLIRSIIYFPHIHVPLIAIFQGQIIRTRYQKINFKKIYRKIERLFSLGKPYLSINICFLQIFQGQREWLVYRQ